MILALLNPMKIIVSGCSYNWDGCIQCLLTRNSLETARNQVISASISWLDRVTSNECHIYGSRFFCDWWKTLYAFGFILYERLFVKGRQMSFHFFFGLIPLQQHEIKEIRPKRINKYIYFFSQKEKHISLLPCRAKDNRAGEKSHAHPWWMAASPDDKWLLFATYQTFTVTIDYCVSIDRFHLPLPSDLDKRDWTAKRKGKDS